MTAWIEHGTRYSRAGRLAGPRRRISVHRNAGSTPSRASTTSRTEMSPPIGEPVAPTGAGDRLEQPGAGQGLQVLGQVRGRHAVVLGEAPGGQRRVGREDGHEDEAVHAPTRRPPTAALSRTVTVRDSGVESGSGVRGGLRAGRRGGSGATGRRGPVWSWRALSASPTPLASAKVRASRAIHSPIGSRCR